MTVILELADFNALADAVSELPGFAFLGSPGSGGMRGRFQFFTALPCSEHQVTAADFASNPRQLQTLPDGNSGHGKAEPWLPPFTGGLLGVMLYEAGQAIAPHPDNEPLPPETPLCWIGDYAWAATFDRDTGQALLVFQPHCPAATQSVVLDSLKRARSNVARPFRLTTPFSAEQSASQYRRGVSRVLDYLAAGDCYQVNLSQRFHAHFEGDGWSAFRYLAAHMPAPYSAYLQTPFGNVMSFSPEQFLGIRDRRVETRPIKGTRPRSTNAAKDLELAHELAASEKDRAENLMIVDLLRNDLGRFCRTGSIQVEELFALKSFANVHHLVSTISGQLRAEVTPWQTLLGCFPGGSITGAPKIRAMQVIRELEPHTRGPYCGSVFYLTREGRLDSNIAIRTLFAQGDSLYCWGGGGVVMDSVPQSEYTESVIKVDRLMRLLESVGS